MAGGGMAAKAIPMLAQGLGSAGGGKGGGGSGPSQQDYQALAFEHQQSKIGANQFGAQTGTGNYTGTTNSLNAGDLQYYQGLGQLQLQQEQASQAASANAAGAAGQLAGLGGGGFGSTSGNFGSA